jgi:hypothetical protein
MRSCYQPVQPSRLMVLIALRKSRWIILEVVDTIIWRVMKRTEACSESLDALLFSIAKTPVA